jgi:hypothetical protein
MRTIALEAGALRLVVLHELGGGIARFDLARADGIDALFRPWDGAGADPNRLGCYVLCPFSNRISGGGFEAGGQFWPLAPNLAGVSPTRSTATLGSGPGPFWRPAGARSFSASKAARGHPSPTGRS